MTEVLRMPSIGVLNLNSGTHQALLAAYVEAQQALDKAEASDPQASTVEPIEQEAVRQACVLFVARALANAGDRCNGGLPLSIITRSTNLFDFFRELPVVVSRLSKFLDSRGTSASAIESQTSVREWQKTLVSMTLLCKKYKELFHRYMYQLEDYKQVAMRLGWMLFLVAKAQLLPPFPDLVSCMELLAGIINVLVANTNKLPDALQAQLQASTAPLDTLAVIAGELKMDQARARQLLLSVDILLSQLLPGLRTEWRQADAKHPAAPRLKTSCTYFEGLTTDIDCLNRCVAALEREYEAIFSKQGELDEREFLSTDFSKFASPRLTPAACQAAACKLQNSQPAPSPLGPGSCCATQQQQQQQPLVQTIVSALHSPLPIMHLAGPNCTPITESMGAAEWLRSLTTALKDEPSANLQRFLQACDPQLGTTLQKRVKEMAEAVLPDEKPSMMPFPLLQPSLNTRHRVEACKLYYHVLEAILMAEERTTGQGAFPGLLSSNKFHCGLMACCLEVVIASYRMVSCAFPRVLECLKLKAFDLSKMIQSFVKQQPALPRELKRHLFQIEEKIVESLGWEAGSPLYPLIVMANSDSQQVPAAASAGRCTSSTGSQPSSPARQVLRTNSASLPSSPKALHRTASLPSSPRSAATQAGPAAAPSPPPAAHRLQQQASSSAAAMDTVMAGAENNAAAAMPMADPGSPFKAPSPKRSKPLGGGFASMMSPLKRARCENSSSQPASSASQLVLEPLPTTAGPPPPQSVLSENPGMSVLFEFLRKALKLVSFRLALLCDSFEFSPLNPRDVFQKVYDTVEHAMYQQTQLFYNRHIDQILLSALYGFCKVNKLNQISFKEIINQYRKQPQSVQAVFRSVILEQSNPGLEVSSRGDIIAFYNQCFVPAMKHFLLKSDGHATAAGLPPMPPAMPARPAGPASKPLSPMSKAGGAPPRALSQLPSILMTSRAHNSHGAMPSLLRSASTLDTTAAPACSTEAAPDASSDPRNASAAQAPHAGLSNDASAVPTPGVEPVAAGQQPEDTAQLHGHSRFQLAAAKGRVRSEHNIPSGLTTLLRALDSAIAEEDTQASRSSAGTEPAAAATAARPAMNAGTQPVHAAPSGQAEGSLPTSFDGFFGKVAAAKQAAGRAEAAAAAAAAAAGGQAGLGCNSSGAAGAALHPTGAEHDGAAAAGRLPLTQSSGDACTYYRGHASMSSGTSSNSSYDVSKSRSGPASQHPARSTSPSVSARSKSPVGAPLADCSEEMQIDESSRGV